MRTVIGILCSAAWLLYLGQFVSAVNFGSAQRMRLQETSDAADPLASHLELQTARWDVWWLWTLPVAGILMLLEHAWWPYAALIGGGAFVDAGGREAAKYLGLRKKGVQTGSAGQWVLTISVFVYLVAVGGLAIVSALLEIG